MYSCEAKTEKSVDGSLTYDDEILLGLIMLNSHIDALLEFARELALVPDIVERAPSA